MRLWSLHPRYLDRQGLLALWREALLARAVLGGRTRGYRNHPQLERFGEARSRAVEEPGHELRAAVEGGEQLPDFIARQDNGQSGGRSGSNDGT